MRMKTVLVVLLALLLAACAGPKLRESAKVKPKKMHRECGIQENVPVTAEQAVCIAGLAGINVNDDAYGMREARAPSGAATWIIDETCGSANPKCIGIVVSQVDGAILDTRYLYAIKSDER